MDNMNWYSKELQTNLSTTICFKKQTQALRLSMRMYNPKSCPNSLIGQSNVTEISHCVITKWTLTL